MRILQEETYPDRLARFWNERAAKYNLNDEFHPPLAAYVVDFADLQPGQAVLDVATGTGTVAFEALQRVGPSGKVVGVDISEAMINKVCRHLTPRFRMFGSSSAYLAEYRIS
jgi:ubiquinone/menaquinone biosynthesis C-methylase UbiE